MPVTDLRLCKGTLTNSNATLYTVPAATKTILKSMTLCNITASPVTVTIKLAGTEIYSALSVPANDAVNLSVLDQILEATELIEGSASAGSAIRYYMSGKQIS